jgi:hypothetical protein
MTHDSVEREFRLREGAEVAELPPSDRNEWLATRFAIAALDFIEHGCDLSSYSYRAEGNFHIWRAAMRVDITPPPESGTTGEAP